MILIRVLIFPRLDKRFKHMLDLDHDLDIRSHLPLRYHPIRQILIYMPSPMRAIHPFIQQLFQLRSIPTIREIDPLRSLPRISIPIPPLIKTRHYIRSQYLRQQVELRRPSHCINTTQQTNPLHIIYNPHQIFMRLLYLHRLIPLPKPLRLIHYTHFQLQLLQPNQHPHCHLICNNQHTSAHPQLLPLIPHHLYPLHVESRQPLQYLIAPAPLSKPRTKHHQWPLTLISQTQPYSLQTLPHSKIIIEQYSAMQFESLLNPVPLIGQ